MKTAAPATAPMIPATAPSTPTPSENAQMYTAKTSAQMNAWTPGAIAGSRKCGSTGS
jgi:hypothetical protein